MRRALTLCLALLTICLHLQAQPDHSDHEPKAPAKPYRILTSGKQITIKSTRDIKSVMAWTSGGQRIVEQKDIHTSTFSFRVTVQQKFVFVMVQMTDGKVYSEKIGVQ